MNPYEGWQYKYITDPNMMWWQFCKDKPKSIGSDTESTGLHIIKDKPFLVQLGWSNTKIVFLFEPTPSMMKMYFKISSMVKWHFLHNLKYDLHMLTNIGYGEEVQAQTNWCDSMAVMRLVTEALSPRNGGDKLGLKSLGVKYIHPYADNSETLIKEAMTKLNKERNKVLAASLKQYDIPGEFTAKGKPKKWGLGAIEDFLKDIMNDLDDLPSEVREIWQVWQEECPEPNYSHIDKALMNQYAGEDIATMLMLMELAMPTLIERNQRSTLERERKCLLPLYRMERVGLEVDMDYLHDSKQKLKKYIISKRKELYEVAGCVIKPSQSKAIVELFDKKWNIVLESSDKQSMKQVIKNFEGEPKRFAQLINILRTSEKWYSTYIVRIEQAASYDGRAYTQINSTGAISGRMSSDFQQFPKGHINDEEGNPLFEPRRLFKVSDNEFKSVYIDYDQIELVIQSHYCVKMKAQGVNLPRAYMPYKCRHYLTGEEFNYTTVEGRRHYMDKQPSGDSVWLTEEGSPWTKTDTHTLTATKAYPDVDPKSDHFKSYCRPKGKTTNFASNYGGGPAALMGPLDISYEEAEMLTNGYREAYPEVIQYQEGIIKAHSYKGYITNHYGRRYYLTDSRLAYTLANACVQGSCADALKEAIIAMDMMLQAGGYKSHMVMPIHDEQSFRIHVSEMHLIPKLRLIMEQAFAWSLVPATAGVEISEDYWSNKVDWEEPA